MSNASAHLLPEATATQERRLEAVSCKAMLMMEASSSADHGGLLPLGDVGSLWLAAAVAST